MLTDLELESIAEKMGQMETLSKEQREQALMDLLGDICSEDLPRLQEIHLRKALEHLIKSEVLSFKQRRGRMPTVVEFTQIVEKEKSKLAFLD